MRLLNSARSSARRVRTEGVDAGWAPFPPKYPSEFNCLLSPPWGRSGFAGDILSDIRVERRWGYCESAWWLSRYVRS